MTRFNIIYEVESPDVNSATAFAHEILFLANADVESVQVRPVAHDESDDKYRTFDEPSVETSPSIFERVNQEWKDSHPWLSTDDSVASPNRIVIE